MSSFRYAAQTADGRAMAGTLDATDVDEARRTLEGVGLRLTQVEQVEPAARARAMSGEDFTAFNQQLAHLTEAGLPIETGLKLIARDMKRGRLAASIHRVVAELEAGVSLPEAFEKHRALFPSMYSSLLDVGVRSNQLPAVLFNLGAHLELLQRLRATLWRATAYPLMILAVMLLIVIFIGLEVVPGMIEVFTDFDVRLPVLTEVFFAVAGHMIYVAGGLMALIVLGCVGWWAAGLFGKQQDLAETLFFPVPLIGGVLKQNAVARWCDVLRLGVQSGQDLPAALRMAGDAVQSYALRRDAERLIQSIERGDADWSDMDLELIPASVPAAIHLAMHRHDLPSLLEHLSLLHQQKAEMRVAVVQAMLAPILLLVVMVVMGITVAALFLPLVRLIESVS